MTAFYNFYSEHLDEYASVLVQEVYEDGKLIDTELHTPYRMDRAKCDELAIVMNKALVAKGQHTSQYVEAQAKKIEPQSEKRQERIA